MRDDNWSRGSRVRQDYGRLTNAHPDPRNNLRGGGNFGAVGGNPRGIPAGPSYGRRAPEPNIIDILVEAVQNLEAITEDHDRAIAGLMNGDQGRDRDRNAPRVNPRTRTLAGGSSSEPVRDRSTSRNPRRGGMPEVEVEPIVEEVVERTPVEEPVVETPKPKKVENMLVIDLVPSDFTTSNEDNRAIAAASESHKEGNVVLNDTALAVQYVTDAYDSALSTTTSVSIQEALVFNEKIKTTVKSLELLKEYWGSPSELAKLLDRRMSGQGAEGDMSEIVFSSKLNDILTTMLRDYAVIRYGLPIDSFASDFEVLRDFILQVRGADSESLFVRDIIAIIDHMLIQPYNDWIETHQEDDSYPLLYRRTVCSTVNYLAVFGTASMKVGQVYRLSADCVLKKELTAIYRKLGVITPRSIILLGKEGSAMTVTSPREGEFFVKLLADII